jgi:hypothetical protein
VDLASIYDQSPVPPEKDRLTQIRSDSLRATLTAAGLRSHEGTDADRKLTELRQRFEPYVYSLSKYFGMPLRAWISEADIADNWRTSQWGTSTGFHRDDRKKTGRPRRV